MMEGVDQDFFFLSDRLFSKVTSYCVVWAMLWHIFFSHLWPDFCMPLYMYGEEELKEGGNNDYLLSETAAKFIVGYLRMSSALWLDFVTQNQVGGKSEDQEENPQHHEVHVELGIFHVQQQ